MSYSPAKYSQLPTQYLVLTSVFQVVNFFEVYLPSGISFSPPRFWQNVEQIPIYYLGLNRLPLVSKYSRIAGLPGLPL